MIEAFIHRLFNPAVAPKDHPLGESAGRAIEWERRERRERLKRHPLVKLARYIFNMTVFTACIAGAFVGLALGVYGAAELKSLWVCLGGIFGLIVSIAVLFWFMEDHL